MKQAIMYGAGNIGRGFIGQLFHMSGYEISFIDVNMTVIDKLNADGQFPSISRTATIIGNISSRACTA